ncbi:hypothetical protein [Yersinia intermedia]|uniref:hypothetical protein n=1 Tax=Yersinia intermedia TaxID=631 RepID=UPI001CFDE0B1|nr:hypothetical protein [Yersinia intermedia]MCB5296292.1 hypothetical protein [Yersinia intermedia]
MKSAIDPTTGKRINANDFRRIHVANTVNGQIPIKALCPYCSQELELRKGLKEHHFWHGTAHGVCPSKAPFGKPYIGLTPTTLDVANETFLWKEFKSKWQLFYQELGRLIPCMSLNEFLALATEAKRKRIFAYQNMTVDDIPYVMVLAYDYPPITGTKSNNVPNRRFWFRFWYNSSLTNISDLWIKNTSESILYRASFTPPVGRVKYPDYDIDLIADKVMVRQPFMQAPQPKLPGFIIDEVNKWIKAN